MIDPGTRTIKARATIPNPDGNLLPGSFGKVEITLDRIPDAIVIPSGAVIPRINDEIVYVCRGGKAVSVTVTSGIRTESGSQIATGLAPGDTLIVSGLLQLTDGKSVQITNLQANLIALAPMNISSVSINRPVLSIVLSILIVLFGAIGYYLSGGPRVSQRRSARRHGQHQLHRRQCRRHRVADYRTAGGIDQRHCRHPFPDVVQQRRPQPNHGRIRARGRHGNGRQRRPRPRLAGHP